MTIRSKSIVTFILGTWLTSTLTFGQAPPNIEYASFDGFDSIQVLEPEGQLFKDVFGDGSDIDINVTAEGHYRIWLWEVNRSCSRTCPAVLPIANDLGIQTNGSFESDNIFFRLNSEDIGGQLFVETSGLDALEEVKATALDGGRVEFQQWNPPGKAATVANNGSNAPEISGTGYGEQANHGMFVFSQPSTFSVTYATDKHTGFQSYRIARAPNEAEFNGQSATSGMEFADFSGWDDATIRTGGQRFYNVFGDGTFDVLVESQGTYNASHAEANSPLEGTQFNESTKEISTGAANEWNSLVFKWEPLGVDFDGQLVVTSEDTDASERVRVAALGHATVEFQDATSGFAAVILDSPESTGHLTGSGFGPDASDGVFLIGTENDASDFVLSYTSRKVAGWQQYRIGRIVDAESNARSVASATTVPEPTASYLLPFVLLFLTTLRSAARTHRA